MSRKRFPSNKKSPHVIINNIDDAHISLYTNEISIRRNKKGICLVTLGLSVFVICIYILSVSVQRAALMKRYADTFNDSLSCNITHANVTGFHVSYKFIVSNVSFCDSNENIVEDTGDENWLYQSNVSVGTVMECYSNLQCDYIYFRRYNSKYDESTRMYLFGGASTFFGSITCVITLLSLCVLLRKDKHDFYTKQWNKNIDRYLKYEFIMDLWIRKCNISLCDDIDDLIFNYSNCMSQHLYDSEISGEEEEGSVAMSVTF